MGKKQVKQFKNKDIQKAKNNPKTNLKTSNYNHYYILLGIVIITIFSFSSSINNGFVNWDDNFYVTNNDYIKNLSPKGIIEIFKSYTKDELPITHLSLAIDYHFWQLNAKPYHTINLIFHILNILLAFKFILLLTKRKEIAIIASLLFAIHPMRVESVAWVAERKDMLFSFFYLSSLISYLYYLKSDYKIRYLFFALLLSIISILSKFAAVTLPVILLLIDYYYQRKFSIKNILEKIPFLIFPLISGIIHYNAPAATILVKDVISNFSFIDTIFLASYSLIFYVLKFILPINLYALYPYPVKVNGLLPIEYYLAPIAVIILIILFFKYYKKLLNISRDIFFGIIFFIITISLVLQIVPFGGHVIAADRYTYIPYIGLFIIVGRLYCYIIDNQNKYSNKIKSYLTIGLVIIALIFSIQTYNRNLVWKDSITLWTDVIEKNPEVAIAYNNRALAKCDSINYQMEFNKRALSINDSAAYQNAIVDYDKAVKIEKKFAAAYYNRGLAKNKLKDYNGAIYDYSNAININPKYVEAYYNRGNAYKDTGNFENAISNYNKAIEINPDFKLAYNNRGVVKFQLKDFNSTVSDFNHVIRLDPGNGLAYFIRGYAKFNLLKLNEACEDWNISSQLGYSEANEMIQKNCNNLKTTKN